MKLSEQQLERLRDALGDVPCMGGLSRPETQALAALARSPRGLVSIPALAQRAGLSITAASGAFRELEREGLAERRLTAIAAGRARPVRMLFLDRHHERYRALARELAAVTLPAAPQRKHPTGIPYRLHHLFWNTDPGGLSIDAHGAYIARRLLSAGDLDGLAWGVEHLPSKAWMQAATARGLSARERKLTANLAAGGEEQKRA